MAVEGSPGAVHGGAAARAVGRHAAAGGAGRALACSPEVLLADAPFGSLDAQAREALQGEVQQVWGETDELLFVTHDVREAALWPTACC